MLKPKWMILNNDPEAHLVEVAEGSRYGFKPLCQGSDLGHILVREAKDGHVLDGGDSFCSDCRMVLGIRIRIGIRKQQLIGSTRDG